MELGQCGVGPHSSGRPAIGQVRSFVLPKLIYVGVGARRGRRTLARAHAGAVFAGRVDYLAVRSSAPQKSPPPGCACRDAGSLVFGIAGPDAPNTWSLAAKACGGRSQRAFWGAEEHRACGQARSAVRHHSRRGCLSAAPAGRVASSATGRKSEHRRAVGASSARPLQ